MREKIKIGEPKGYQLPDSDRYVSWEEYRQLTGLCETCGQRINNHEKCEACGTLCGPGHSEGRLQKFRGRNLCGYCPSAWQRLEERLGRRADWREFRQIKYEEKE